MTRPIEPRPRRDWSTRAGAEALAEILRRYWRDHGFHVEIWLEVQRGGREPLVGIKSRLPGGLPPSRAEASL